METPFTCITCRMVFEDLTQQKSHYQTAWHCFNLKRKVAGLAPVTQDVFDEKVAALKGDGDQSTKKQKPKKNDHKQRKEKTRRVFVQNATIPPEIDNLPAEEPQEEKAEEPMKTEEEIIADRLKNARAIPINESLFDNHKSKTLEGNLEYMRKKFGFFIPDIDYLVDLEGLIGYLGQKIGIGYACLYCPKELGSATAIQSHMVDKCHCKINFYGQEEEFADFYDWSPLLGEEEEEKSEEDKETDDKDKQIIVSTEQNTKAIQLTETGGELLLPSGVAIGHREFALYYKQKHRPMENRVSVLTNQLARQYRDLGIAKPHTDVDYRARRKKDLAWMKLGTNANKLPKFMRHNTSMC